MRILSNNFVPTAAVIEYFVLERALSRNETIAKASANVVPSFGILPNGPFLHRETRLLGMLYTLLVFPSEAWRRQGLFEVVVERAKTDKDLLSKNFEVVSVSTLRSIRNAVSHAKITFEDGKIRFEDSKGYALPHFSLTLTIEEAVNLVLVLGRAFHECEQVNMKIANAGISG